MEFNLVDFSDRVEFRLSNEFIEHLKTYTKTVTTKCSRLGQHYVVKRDYWIFPEKEPVGKRLFGRWDYHRGRKTHTRAHQPYVTMPQIRLIHAKTSIAYSDIEKAVTRVRVCGSGLSWPISLPVHVNNDWAFLIGLWFSAGGYTSRKREGRCEEYLVRYAVDKRPYDELVEPIRARLGYKPTDLTKPSYVNWESGHKLDAHKWRQFGSEPRGFFKLHRPFREILLKFGLPDPDEVKLAKQNRGGRSAFRQYSKKRIPRWILGDVEYSHAFIEGYLNGPSTASQFCPTPKRDINRLVEPRFRGVDIEEVNGFYNFFADYLSKRGISGYTHINFKHGHLTGVTHEIGYLIHNNESLKRLYEQFNIRRSDTRARLLLNYYMNQLLLEVCRKLNSFEILLFGMLIEKEHSVQEITEALRCEKEETEKTLEHMQQPQLRLVDCKNGKWFILPKDFKTIILAELNAKEQERRLELRKQNGHFFSICGNCGALIPKHYHGPCKCGGQYVPISRSSAIRKLGLYAGPGRRINKISTQTIPLPFSIGVQNKK